MPDYVLTVKVRCPSRNTLKEIDRIFMSSRFRESFSASVANHLQNKLADAYLEDKKVDIQAKFSRKRAASKKGQVKHSTNKKGPKRAATKRV